MKASIIRKEHILKTAFEVWGNKDFHDTSLKDLAKRLRVSKTALYRYFKNKEEILSTMEEWFFGRFFEMNNRVICACEAGESDLISLFIKEYYAFFASQPGLYVYFLRLVTEESFSEKPGMKEIREKMIVLLKECIAPSYPWKEESRLVYIRFLFTTIIFWLFLSFISEKMEWVKKIKPAAENLDAYLQLIGNICKSGLSEKTGECEIPYGEIERRASVEADELPEKNRIIKAVLDTISEAGLAEATIDRVAAALGIKKSSLYFYFQNKDEMLAKTISLEQEQFLSLLEKKLSGLGSFCERSYAYMVCVSSYMQKDPSMLTLFNWLRFRKIRISVPPLKESYTKKLFAFVENAARRGELKSWAREPAACGSFLHVLTFQEMIQSRRSGSGERSLFAALRVMHGLFLHGFSMGSIADSKYPQEGVAELHL